MKANIPLHTGGRAIARALAPLHMTRWTSSRLRAPTPCTLSRGPQQRRQRFHQLQRAVLPKPTGRGQRLFARVNLQNLARVNKHGVAVHVSNGFFELCHKTRPRKLGTQGRYGLRPQFRDARLKLV